MERKTYTCDHCEDVEDAKAAKDWPQLKLAGKTRHFCGVRCLSTWISALPQQLALEDVTP